MGRAWSHRAQVEATSRPNHSRGQGIWPAPTSLDPPRSSGAVPFGAVRGTVDRVRVRAGTSGFSYKEWVGHFYPERTKPKEMLARYAARLPTVEINNTFYRLPRKDVLESWRDETPEDFRFAIKASRRITHFARLAGTEELLGYLFSNIEVLGSRLGTVLFQLPPQFKLDAPRLEAFLGQAVRLGGAARLVLEFRHESWFTDEVFGLLERHGAALCGGEGDDEGRVPPPLVKTANFAYLRLRKDIYEPGELEIWAEKIRTLGTEETFVYFKHETTGPMLAEQLLELLPEH